MGYYNLMKKITEIQVTVKFFHHDEVLTHATVAIEVEPGQPIKVQHLTDACQRSVAHCIDELNKDLDLSR